jgi:GNAT superfamily N-acetyltransferase
MQVAGIGTRLLERIESFCRDNGATTIEVGASAPYYVVPGVDVRSTEAVCFFQERGYRRNGDAVNQSVRLANVPEPALPCRTAAAEDHARIVPWVTEHFPNWLDELARGVHQGTCVVHEDLGFACYDVNRDAWFGPMATRPDLRGMQGIGTATLLSALQHMRSRGYEYAEIAWSGPLLFYMKAVGARVSRVFWCYTKTL